MITQHEGSHSWAWTPLDDLDPLSYTLKSTNGPDQNFMELEIIYSTNNVQLIMYPYVVITIYVRTDGWQITCLKKNHW